MELRPASTAGTGQTAQDICSHPPLEQRKGRSLWSLPEAATSVLSSQVLETKVGSFWLGSGQQFVTNRYSKNEVGVGDRRGREERRRNRSKKGKKGKPNSNSKSQEEFERKERCRHRGAKQTGKRERSALHWHSLSTHDRAGNGSEAALWTGHC